MATPSGYQFGPYRLDVERRRLLRDGQRVPLRARAHDLLLTLVSHSGEIVDKDELIRVVWQDVAVEENNLNQQISALRRVLGDTTNGGLFIETIPRRGYRFVASVRELSNGNGHVVPAPESAAPVIRSPAETGSKTPKVVLAFSLAIVVLAVAGFAFAKLSATSQARHNAEAAYRRGLAYWNTRNGVDLQRAILSFHEAIAADGTYASAYAGLANSYAFDFLRWRDGEAAAQKAIALDPTLAAPHAAIGFIRLFHQWRWADAEREFQQAIVLDPGYATAHQWYATLFATQGRLTEAGAEIRLALALDPSSLSIRADAAQLLYFGGDYNAATAICQDVLALDPNFVNAHLYLSNIYIAQGAFDRAVEEFLIGRQLIGEGSPQSTARLRQAFSRGGINGFWRSALDSMRDAVGEADPYALAAYHQRLGNSAQALDLLSKAVDLHGFYVVYMWVDPTFTPLRGNEMFRALARRIGILPATPR